MFVVSAVAQTNTVDSLKNLLAHEPDSLKYLHILNSLAFRTHRINPDSSLMYSKQAMQLALNFKDDTSYANSLYYAGIAHTVKGDYKEALSYTIQALKIAETNDDKKRQLAYTMSIGIIYEYLGEYNKAAEYDKGAIELAQSINDLRAKATAQNNYAILLAIYMNDLQGALNNFKLSLEIRRRLKLKHQIASSLNNIGEIYMMMQQNEHALIYYTEALEIYTDMNDLYGLAENYKNIGRLLFAQKNYNASISSIENSIRYAKELKLKHILREDYNILAEVHAALGDYKNAFYYQVQFCVVNDSINNEKNNKQIAELKTRYETEKAQQDLLIAQKEKELSELVIENQKSEIKRQRLLQNALIIGIILILIILILIFNRSLQRIIQKEKV